MLTFKIAFRNVSRNRRRSTMTMLTIGLGAAAILLLGALMSYIILEFQTSTVRRTGHVAVFQQGYFKFGAGNPAAYSIKDYHAVMRLVGNDPVVKPLLLVATPTQVISGVAGNYDAGTSKTFFGQGIIPDDRVRMREWNPYNMEIPEMTARPLTEANGAAIGSGIARILQLCGELDVPNCPRADNVKAPSVGESVDDGLMDLALRERSLATTPPETITGPKLDLLAATASGAPNVVSVRVERAVVHGAKDLDDNLVIMQLPLAQKLIYGRNEARVTAVNLQLRRTEDVPVVRAALTRLFEQHRLDLEVRDFTELTPLYSQTLSFFGFLFGFIALVIGIIVLFTIMNTMTMSVMERVNEIGTGRALGAQRNDVRLQFVTEGALLGVIGATFGVVVASVIVLGINQAGVTWTPPTSAGPVPLRLYLFGSPLLLGGIWLGLAVVATVAALLPANRAARMTIVDALRHV